jgi:hypothetical protein
LCDGLFFNIIEDMAEGDEKPSDSGSHKSGNSGSLHKPESDTSGGNNNSGMYVCLA